MHAPVSRRLWLGVLLVALCFPAVGRAVTRYVSDSAGNDGTSCPASTNPATPRKTLNAGVACMAGGDTLVVRGGTYANQCLADFTIAQTVAIPSGSSFASATTIRAAAGETVWIRNSAQCNPGQNGIANINTTEPTSQYIVFDGINVSGNGTFQTVTLGAPRIRYQNMIAEHGSECFQGAANENIFDTITTRYCGYNTSMQDVCPDPSRGCHGMYITGAFNLLTKITTHNTTGHGITLSCEQCVANVHDNVVTRTRAYNNYFNGILTVGNNDLLSDNLVHNNSFNGNSSGILVGGNAQVINNTIYGNDLGGIQFNYGTTLVRNNIILDNADAALLDAGGTHTADTNLCNSGCDLIGSSAIFVNAGAGDFRPASPTVASVNTGNQSVPAGTPVFDHFGMTRTAGGARDIGAIEYPDPLFGPATAVAFTQQPSTTQAGVVISPAVTVRVIDAGGLTVTTSTVAITLALGANPGSAAFGGTLLVNAVDGIATFPNLTLSQAGVGYTVIASSPGLTSATSAAFTITAPPPPPEVVVSGSPRSSGFLRR